MGISVGTKNRKVRQEALRDQLKAGGHLQYVVEIAKEFSERGSEMEQAEIATKKHAADIHLKLISKFLPDLKAVEMTGADGGDIGIDHMLTVEFVGVESPAT